MLCRGLRSRQVHLVLEGEAAGWAFFKGVEGGVVGEGLDSVFFWMEGHVAQPGPPAIFQPLVVAKDLVDGIAGVSLGCKPPLAKYMAAEDQEDVRVFETSFFHIPSPRFPSTA